MRLERGSKLGPYEILSPIGAGGMGEVYRAHDPQLGRDVAIKVLPEEVSISEERLTRFENEARLASSLNHPNIVTIYSIGWQDQRRYIAMELIDGRTLQELMGQGPLSVDQALRISAQVADGLAKAHDAGIIHRDLKPKNVMITKDGLAKILDFGLSKLSRSIVDSEAPTASIRNSGEDLTRPGTILGTVEYMSPEQAAGKPVDFRSDQFSMGSLMYAILTGSRPFHRESVVQTLSYIIEGEPRSLDELNPRVPPALKTVVRRCLMKNPRDRYASTQELARDLRQLELNHQVILRHWTRRDWIRASIGLLIFLVVAGSLWIWSQRPYRPNPSAVKLYQQGLTAMHSMAFERAGKAFSKALEIDPKFALAQASLAKAYDELDYSEKAKEQMLRAATIAQETRLSSMDRKRLKAFQSVVLHQYDQAVPLFRQLEQAADKQDKPAAALESGCLAEKQYDNEGAAAAYERAVKMNPAYAAARLRLGFIRQRRGEDELALKSFTEAESLYDAAGDYEGITEALYQRANLLNRRGRAAEAMPSIDKAIALARLANYRYQEIRLQILQSSAVRKLGQTMRASELAQQAIDAALTEKMDNLATSAMIALGAAAHQSGEYESAEKNFRRALDVAQRGKVRRYEAMALLSLGSLFEQKNQPESAKQFVENALPIFKQAGLRRETVQSMTVLGGILRELGDYDEGFKVLSEALPGVIQLHDTTTEVQIRDRLADILQAQGKWPEALQEAERSANLPAPAASRAYGQLICVGLYWRLGRRQDANRLLTEVEMQLQTNEDPEALASFRLRQAEIAYVEGQFRKAKTNARMAIAAIPASGDQAEPDARLIEALASIRDGSRSEGIRSAEQIIQEFEKFKMAGSAAYARLATAEALIRTNERHNALYLALKALEFFERLKLCEPAFRAHLVLAEVSDNPADVSAHRRSARSSLTELKALWSAGNVESYLQRPDIKQLSRNMQF